MTALFNSTQDKISSKSLSLKLLFLTTLMTIIICFTTSKILYNTISQSLYEKETSEMSYDSNTISYIVQTSISQAEMDASFLSLLLKPNPAAIIENQDTKNELTKEFIKLLNQREHYFQIRYISAQDNGQEIIRVEKDANDNPFVQSQLQQKGNEHYFQQALKSRYDVYISRLDYNREKGRIEIPKTPTIRAIKVIKDKDKNPIGMIIINANYNKVLKDITPLVSDTQNLRIYNYEGDYISYNKEKQDFDFKLNEYQEHVDETFLKLEEKLKQTDIPNSGNMELTLNNKPEIIHYKKFAYNEDKTDYLLAIVLSKKLDEILKPAQKSKNYVFLIGLALLIVGWLITLIITNNFQKSIKYICNEILDYEKNKQIPELPINRLDEIGKLARTIEEVIFKLEDSRAQEQQTKDHLQATIDTALDAIITIDDLGVIQTFNPSAEKMFGYDKEEVIGKNVKVLMPEPYHSEHDGYIHNYKSTGHAKVIGIGREVTGRRKNGDTFPMELGVNRMTLSGKFMFVGTIRDITERKQVEEEMIRSNEELERFAYVASHDLREPLRIVSSFTELLETQYKESLDEKGTQCMDFILEATNRMQDMINDLLDYSRAGTDDAAYEEVDCNKTMEAVTTNLMEIIDQSGAQIKYKNLPTVSAPPIRVLRLFQNIIGNAIKYTKKGTVPKIIIKAAEKDNEWLFTFKDNGIGMKPEHLDKIFTIFQRLHRREEYAGTGIGLAICKRIIESLGGDIWVESELDKGSTFYFTIPKREKIENTDTNVTYAFK